MKLINTKDICILLNYDDRIAIEISKKNDAS